MVDPTNFSAATLRTLSPTPESTPAQDDTTAQPAQEDQAAAKTATAAPQERAAAARAAKARKTNNYSTVPFWTGMGLSILWVAVVATVMTQAGTAQTFAGQPLVNWAIAISAIISPIAMVWMVAAYLQRAADVQSVTEPLRRQLAMITGESGAAEVRIRRFNHAIKEQLELLRSTKTIGDDEIMAIMERINGHKSELEGFEQHSLDQVRDIQDVIHRSMSHIEQLMEDKFAMMRILDNKLVQSGDSVARQAESMKEVMTSLLQEVETNAVHVASAVERAMQDSKKLSDTARAQETSLLGAAETAADTLSELSTKIDQNIAHFLERSGMAREEAERLTNALDSQTRSIDELSSILPSRITEAEAVLRGVADRLYASEQMAREQAVNLTAKLEEQIEGLQSLMDRFANRVNDIDGTLQQRRTDLDGLVIRISGASNDLADQLHASIDGLGKKSDDVIAKFASTNKDARQSTDQIAAQMTETAARYEAATSHLNNVSNEHSVRMRKVSGEIAEQLTQFESLHRASQQAGQDVQARAIAAAQNMQQVLERLLATRDATQSIGETLVDKLSDAVGKNERVIIRLNEAARMSVHALGIATESLGRQETEITAQSQAAEQSLRSTISLLQQQSQSAQDQLAKQNEDLTAMLAEIRGRLDATDTRLQEFADNATIPVQAVIDQLDEQTKQGSKSITKYGDDMQAQLEKLQLFNDKINTMGQDVSQMTSSTLSAIEDLNTRFQSARTAQEETSRAVIETFNTVADRLQTEVNTVGSSANEAAAKLKDAATKVGQQTAQLQTESQESGAKIQLVTEALQKEAQLLGAMLEQQSASINAELAKAGTRFADLSDTLKEKTEAAYAMLDRVAAHYNEVTRATTQDFEDKAGKLDATASDATGRVQTLTGTIESQIALINVGTTQLESHASRITTGSARSIERLDELNAKFTTTQTSAIEGTDRVAAKLEEKVHTFKDMHGQIHEAAEASLESIHRAGSAFGEQASRMLDTTHQVEDSIRSLNAATTSFADQTTQVRSAMEQHNAKLILSLKDSIDQIDRTSEKLQQVSASAIMNADQANVRYDNLAENASSQIKVATKDLVNMADGTQTALSSLSASITQQVASLNLVSEQITEQQRILGKANDTHREQMQNLFDKINEAHGEASMVAERTISRLSDTLSTVQKHITQLDDGSQTALAHIIEAGTGFGEQAAQLVSNARQAEEQAKSAILVTESLQNQAKDLNDALTKETERTGALLSDLIGKLASGSGEMMDVSGSATGALSDLQMGLSKQTKALQESMDQIASRQQVLTQALQSQEETLASLVSQLSQAQDETASAAERASQKVTEGTRQIEQQLSSMEGKTSSTVEAIQNATNVFVNESSSISARAVEAEEKTTHLANRATELQEHISTACAKIDNSAQNTANVIATATGDIQEKTLALRDVSERTETSLTNLGSTVTQQTTAITGNLDTIFTKQTELGSALDVQREMLGNMVTRLTLAQDETAAAAERSASRLSDSTTQILHQMEVLDEQTQKSTAAIRVAGAGVADETANITKNTHEAEDRIKDLIKSAADLHDEARKAREITQQEATSMIEQVRTVMTQLDNTVQQLKQQGGNVSGQLDKSVLDFSTVAKSASDILTKESERLSTVSGQAVTNIEGVNVKISDSVKLINDASEMTGTHGRDLMETAEKATSQLVTLLSQMTESNNAHQTMVETATQRLTDARAAMEKELQIIAELSARAVEQVMGAGSTLAIQSDALRANLSASESALSQAAETVREETITLPNILGRSTKEIEKTAAAFKSQTVEISEAMLKTTDRCINTTGTIRDVLMDEAKNMVGVVEVADKTLYQFTSILTKQINAIKDGTSTLSDEQKELAEKATQTVAQLTAAGNRLTQLRGETQATADKITHDFELIEAKADATNKKLSSAGATLLQQVEQLASVTEKAEGKMLGSSQNFREQLERVRAGVQTQIDDINRGLMQITAQLDRTGTSLRSSMASTVIDVEKIAGRFDQTSKETANQLTDRTARMRVATEEVAKLLNGFGDQIDTLLGRLGTASEGIKRHETDLVGHMQQAFSHLGAVVQRLDSTKTLADNVSEAAISKLNEVSQSVEKQMRHLAEGGQTVTEIIQTVSQTYADQVQKVSGGVISSQEQINAMTKSIEDMQQRTDRMRVTLKLQGEDLLGSLEQILAHLSGAGDAMSSAVDGNLQQKAINSLKKIS
ncbi:MAG: hypothetical protein EOM37_03340 [Proteobacteria bacterium]|nr:hypothetical protein [Pseudomonadota bacterium]